VLRATLRTALAHKGRLLLSALSVVLGVAFVAGTYVFTDTLQRTFGDLFGQVQPDILVSPAAEAPSTGVDTLPGSALQVLAGVDGVAAADGLVQVFGVTLVAADGEAVGTGGAPTFGVSWSDEQDLSPLRLVEGRGPAGPDEVAVDVQALESSGYAVGDQVRVLTPGQSVQARLVGAFRFGASSTLAGATFTAFTPQRAQDLLLGGDRWTQLRASAVDGVSQRTLADRVQAALAGDPVEVQTGEEAADEATEALTQGLTFVTTFLLVFAGVALVVGAFIIVNTFSVLIARRTRELALLRAVGASRRQITGSVLVEALVVGLVGGVLGLALGVVLAVGLRGLFSVLGLDIPAGGLVVLPRTAVVAVGVGVGLTVAAAWFPARRAGRVPPMAALRDDVVVPTRSLHLRAAVGATLGVVGTALLLVGLFAAVPRGITLVGAGALLLFLSVALLAAVVGGGALAALGTPWRRTAVGRMAVRNAQRDRRRTAATAGALMVGLALVTMIGVLGSSASRSIEATITDVIRADYVVTSTSFQPFPTEVVSAVEAVDGVGLVARVGTVPIRLADDTEQAAFGPGGGLATVVDPATISDLVVVEVTAGSLSSLADGAVALDSDTAQEQQVGVGDRVPITWGSGEGDARLGAIVEPTGQIGGLVVARSFAEDLGLAVQEQQLFVAAADDVDAAELRTPLEEALEPYPVVRLQDQTQFADQIRGQVNQLLSLVYALLGLAVVIAVLGIVNTLVLSVLERTREIGLLRAVGTSRRQVRRMVRVEAVLIAVYGAVLGIGLGLLFGVAVQRSLADEGIDRLAVPWTLLGAVLLVSAGVGVLAAILPARRAARLDVLGAIAAE